MLLSVPVQAQDFNEREGSQVWDADDDLDSEQRQEDTIWDLDDDLEDDTEDNLDRPVATPDVIIQQDIDVEQLEAPAAGSADAEDIEQEDR